MRANKSDFRDFLRYLFMAKNPAVFIVMFVLVNVMLSQVFFLYRNQKSEEEFFKTIQADYRFGNENIFADLNYNKQQRMRTQNSDFYGYKQSFLHYLDVIEELSGTEGVTYFNYDLETSLVLENEEGDKRSFRFFGIEDPSFFSYNNLILDEEIREMRDDIVILPDTMKDLFSKGDIVDVYLSFQGYSIDRLTIQGFYHVITQMDASYGKKDTFVNSRGAIVSNDFMKKVLDNDEDILRDEYMKVSEEGGIHRVGGMDIVNVVYGIDDYGSFLSFEDKIASAKEGIVSYSGENDVLFCGVSYVSTDISNQLEQIATVKQMNALFSLLLCVVFLPFLFSYIRYYLLSLEGDIRQFYIFGIPLQKLRIYLTGSFMIFLVIALAASILPSSLISGLLGRSITQTSLYYYDKFARYASNGIHPNITDSGSFYTGMDLLSWSVIYITDIVIVITAVILWRSKLSRGIRDHD